jgi:hypothetical protein
MSPPDDLIAHPGHNYGDKPFDTLGNLKIKHYLLKT